jgi:hypothetical protein
MTALVEHAAALEIRQNYPAIRRPLQWQAVYLANISISRSSPRDGSRSSD